MTVELKNMMGRTIYSVMNDLETAKSKLQRDGSDEHPDSPVPFSIKLIKSRCNASNNIYHRCLESINTASHTSSTSSENEEDMPFFGEPKLGMFEYRFTTSLPQKVTYPDDVNVNGKRLREYERDLSNIWEDPKPKRRLIKDIIQEPQNSFIDARIQTLVRFRQAHPRILSKLASSRARQRSTRPLPDFFDISSIPKTKLWSNKKISKYPETPNSSPKESNQSDDCDSSLLNESQNSVSVKSPPLMLTTPESSIASQQDDQQPLDSTTSDIFFSPEKSYPSKQVTSDIFLFESSKGLHAESTIASVKEAVVETIDIAVESPLVEQSYENETTSYQESEKTRSESYEVIMEEFPEESNNASSSYSETSIKDESINSNSSNESKISESSHKSEYEVYEVSDDEEIIGGQNVESTAQPTEINENEPEVQDESSQESVSSNVYETDESNDDQEEVESPAYERLTPTFHQNEAQDSNEEDLSSQEKDLLEEVEDPFVEDFTENVTSPIKAFEEQPTDNIESNDINLSNEKELPNSFDISAVDDCQEEPMLEIEESLASNYPELEHKVCKKQPEVKSVEFSEIVLSNVIENDDINLEKQDFKDVKPDEIENTTEMQEQPSVKSNEVDLPIIIEDTDTESEEQPIVENIKSNEDEESKVTQQSSEQLDKSSSEDQEVKEILKNPIKFSQDVLSTPKPKKSTKTPSKSAKRAVSVPVNGTPRSRSSRAISELRNDLLVGNILESLEELPEGRLTRKKLRMLQGHETPPVTPTRNSRALSEDVNSAKRSTRGRSQTKTPTASQSMITKSGRKPSTSKKLNRSTPTQLSPLDESSRPLTRSQSAILEKSRSMSQKIQNSTEDSNSSDSDSESTSQPKSARAERKRKSPKRFCDYGDKKKGRLTIIPEEKSKK